MSAHPQTQSDKGTLAQELAEQIRVHGPISVAEYMERAADAYYSTRQPFGTEGDFITAPDISQMFGEMIGTWLVDLWLQMGRPAEVKLVELGPGMGTLACDIMRTISTWPDFKAAVTLHLVEASPRLREIQAEALKGQPVMWHDFFRDVPDGISFVIANEFFDALPVHQFIKNNSLWQERLIGHDAAADKFFYTTAPQEGEGGAGGFPAAPDGSIFEMSPASLSIIEEVAHKIAAHGGASLIIDYGHAMPGFGDTVQALFKHTYVDPLENPGGRDITAHVDFGTFRAVAAQTVSVKGPVTQGQFLTAMGIEMRAMKLCENASEQQRDNIMADLRRLVSPEQMGRLFKVMAMTAKEAIIEPAGFGAVNHEVSDD